MTLEELNILNAERTAILRLDFERRAEDPQLMREALDAVARELTRGMPAYYQQSLEFFLERAETFRDATKRLGATEFARRGGKAPKGDVLQSFIERAVESDPRLTPSLLLDKLRSEAIPGGEIESVGERTIEFSGPGGTVRTANITGLKHRLWRAKEKKCVR